jgi:dTDP-4-dehydrorhamnose reductase
VRTLILGGEGMLGQAVRRAAARRGWPALAASSRQADVTEPSSLHRLVDTFRPELVVNCAAFTRVDDCETRREHALSVNGRALEHVTAAAARCGAVVAQLSTDYVFDGSAQRPYPPHAATAPLSVYGESKRLGEQLALAYERTFVLRTSWLFGPGGPNFVRLIAGLLADRRAPLRVVDDQVGGPTYTPYLAAAVLDLAQTGARGILHYQNREAVSWHGFAVVIAALLDPRAEVLPVSTEEFPRPATRPSYSVLDVAATEAQLRRPVESWRLGLADYLAHSTNDGRR